MKSIKKHNCCCIQTQQLIQQQNQSKQQYFKSQKNNLFYFNNYNHIFYLFLILLFHILITPVKNQILISQIYPFNSVINATTTYTFTIIRFANTTIPNNSNVLITFPGQYAGLSPTSCKPFLWTNASAQMTCTVSNTQLTIKNGFPNDILLNSFSVNVSGIQNPIPANDYGLFTVVLSVPLASGAANQSDGGSGASVSITPATATCPYILYNGFVNQQGSIQIIYSSNFITNPLSGNYNLRVRMATAYDQNPSQNINISISNSLQTFPPFTFQFVNTFNISLLMPPSTKPQYQFIQIESYTLLGLIDTCKVSIQNISPNNFQILTLSTAEVQSTNNLTILMLPKAPILPTDTIKIVFLDGSQQFSLTGIKLQAQFLTGYIGPRALQRSNNIITIYPIVEFTLVNDDLSFVLQNITFPFSTKTTSITFSILTNLSYVRDQRTVSYQATAGLLPSVTQSCNIYEIGYATSCIFDIKFKNFIKSDGSIQIVLPTGFSLLPNNTTCPTQGIGVSVSSTCFYIDTNNTIKLYNLTTGTSDLKLLPLKITAVITIPTQIKTYTLTVYTKSYFSIVDSGQVTLTSINRVFLPQEVTITSNQVITYSPSIYTFNMKLPLILGLKYQIDIFMPFQRQGSLSINNGSLNGIYNSSTSILSIFNASKNTNNDNISLIIQGFLTFESTQPKTVYANLYNSEIRYFYFNGYNLVATTPRTITFVQLNKSNSIVGTSFIATFSMSDIKNGDTILFTSGYSINNQSSCSLGIITCGFNKQIKVLNNFIITNPFIFNITMINLDYVGAVSAQFTVKDSTGVYQKQIGNYIYGASDPNIINVTYTQSDPYYNQNSTYTFNISLTTASATNLNIQIPNTFIVYSTTCISGCTYQPSVASNNMIYNITTTVIRLSILVKNPQNGFINTWSFISSIISGTKDLYQGFKPIYPCNFPCRSCNSSTNISYCTSCYLWTTNNKLRQNQCVQNCQSAQFLNTNYQCKACNVNCSSCQNTSQLCTGCINAITFVLFQNKCITGCPYGYFKDSTLVQPICRLCNFDNPNCIQCSSINFCIDCDNTTFLFQNRCVQSCTGGYYAKDGQCMSCSPTNASNICTGCNGNSTSPLFGTCTSCIQDYFIQNGTCVPQCSQGLFKGATNCQPCVFPCLTCQNTSSTCTSCQKQNNLTGVKLYLFNNTCLENKCPDNYYISLAINICIKCEISRNCSTCTALLCLTCVSSYYLYSGSCLLNCPNGTYKNSDGINCSPCISTCASCVNSASYCTSCPSNYIFHPVNNSCLVTCPATYYNKNFVCQNCISPCKNCASQTICTSCQTANWRIQNQTCVENCSNPYYKSSTNNLICQTCRDPCDTCDIFSDNCTSCLTGYAFFNQLCTKNCPQGYYFISDSCVLCPDLCKTCLLFGQEIRCTLCDVNATFYGFQCVSDCPANTVLQDPYCISNSCSGIANCSICSHLRCLQCAGEFTLNNASQCQNATNGAVLNSVSQIPVPFPFLIILIALIVTGIIMKFQFSKMYVPVYIYSFAGILEIGSIVLWSTMSYLKMNQLFTQSAADSSTNQGQIDILLLIPYGLLGAYIIFNLISVICFCIYICSDRLFKNWLNQGNYCSVTAIFLFGMIFSFRFLSLMFSRLAHKQFFSAVITKPQKYISSNIICILSIFLIDIPCIVIAGLIAYNQVQQNYLFFSSLEVAAVCLIMIIINILYLLAPSDYSLRKKQQYQQGNDQDQGRSVQQIMIGMNVVEEQYNQGKQYKQERQDIQQNPFSHTQNQNQNQDIDENFSFQGQSPGNLLALKKGVFNLATNLKEHSQLQLNNQQDNIFRQKVKQQRQSKLRQLAQQMQRQEQQNNRKQVQQLQQLAKQLDTKNPMYQFQPSRPVGSIIKQLIAQYDQEFDQEQQQDNIFEEAQDDSIYDRVLNTENTVSMQQQIQYKLQKEKQQALQIKRKEMEKINRLMQQLRKRQQQQLQLKQKMMLLLQEQNLMKNKQFQKAREVMQRNKMGVQDKLSQLSQMFRNRNNREKQRKDRIKQLQKQRKSARRKIDQIQIKNLVYPKLEQEIKESKLKQIKVSNPAQLSQDILWPEKQMQVNFQNPTKKWKFGDSSYLQQQQNQQLQDKFQLQQISQRDNQNPNQTKNPGFLSKRSLNKSKQILSSYSKKNQQKQQSLQLQSNQKSNQKFKSKQFIRSQKIQDSPRRIQSSRRNYESNQLNSRNQNQSQFVKNSFKSQQNRPNTYNINLNTYRNSQSPYIQNQFPFQQTNLVQRSQLTHWPIDPQLQQQILRVQKKANNYLQKSRQSIPNNYYFNNEQKANVISDFDEYQNNNDKSSNFTQEAIIYQEYQDDQEQNGQSLESQKNNLQNALRIQSQIKMPKGRVNRKVFDLKPDNKNNHHN